MATATAGNESKDSTTKENASVKDAVKQSFRTHGCKFPLHPLQILAWFLVSMFASEFYILCIPVLYPIYNYIAAILLGIILIVSTISGFIAMLSDASDINVLSEHVPKKVKLEKGQHVIGTDYFCSVCTVYVGSKSKHCSACNKCVSGFDHHCKWLNNCIGDRNYKVFLVYVSSTFMALVLLFLLQLSLFIEFFVNKTRISDRVFEMYHDFDSIPFISLIGFFTALTLPAIYLIGQLFFFHVTLIRRGQTTYEYIIEQRELYLKELKEKEERETAISLTNMSPGDGQVTPRKAFIDDVPEQAFRQLHETASEELRVTNKPPLPPIRRGSVSTPSLDSTKSERPHVSDLVFEMNGDVEDDQQLTPHPNVIQSSDQ